MCYMPTVALHSMFLLNPALYQTSSILVILFPIVLIANSYKHCNDRHKCMNWILIFAVVRQKIVWKPMNHLVITWWPLLDHLLAAWWPFWDHFKIPGWSLGDLFEPLVDHFRLWNHFGIACCFETTSIVVFWPHIDHFGINLGSIVNHSLTSSG